MYAVYNYKAGATSAQVLTDLVAILTGTTNVAGLSASCVQANTSINATVAAGWTVFDAAASASTQCIRALNQDGTSYKYALVGGVTLSAYESWNASTHVGTNLGGGFAANTDFTNGGYLYIYASPRNIVILGWTTAGGYGATPAILEITRDNIPAGYPCWITLSVGLMAQRSCGFSPRVKKGQAVGDQLNLSCMTAVIWLSNSTGYGSGTQSFYRDGSETQYLAMYPLAACVNPDQATDPGLWLGQGYELKSSPGATSVNALDEIIYNGTTYVAFKISTGNPLWVPKQ